MLQIASKDAIISAAIQKRLPSLQHQMAGRLENDKKVKATGEMLRRKHGSN